MLDSALEIRRLRRQNGLLMVACVVLGLAAYFFYMLADRPSLNIYEDFSLQYSPGLWWSNEKTIYAYYSEDMESLAVGYFDKERGRLFDIAWIMFVESQDEAIRRSKPLSPEERRKLYRELGISD